MAKNEKAKAWITKYALTKGIFEEEGEICHDTSSDMFSYGKWDTYVHKGEWFRNKEDALKKAEEMRLKKIASLEKQLIKYKNMTF